MEKQEFIEKSKKTAEAYKAAIKRMEGEVSTMLCGKLVQTTGTNGIPIFHEKYNEIRKINYNITDAKNRLALCEKGLYAAMAE